MFSPSRLDRFTRHHNWRLVAALGPLVALYGLALSPRSLPAQAWIECSLAALVLASGYEVFREGFLALFLEFRPTEETLLAAVSLLGFLVSFLLSALDAAGRLGGPAEGAVGGAPLLYAASALVIWTRLLQRRIIRTDLPQWRPKPRHLGWRAEVKDQKLLRQVGLSYGALVIFCLSLGIPSTIASGAPAAFLTTAAALVALFSASSPGTILLARRLRQAQGRRGAGTDLPLEELSRVDTVILEKSGVLTQGRPQVRAVHPLGEGWSTDDVLHLAAIAELKVAHPIREAILSRYQAHSRTILHVKDCQALPGKGVRALYLGKELLFGNLRLFQDRAWAQEKLQALQAKRMEWSRDGESVLFLSLGGELAGAVSLMDPLRPEGEATLAELRRLGVRTCLLSCDSPASAEALAEKFSWLEVHAGLLPEEKASFIDAERSKGRPVAVVTCSQETSKMHIAIDGHLMVEDDLPGVLALLSQARSLLREERRGFLLLSLYHAAVLPIVSGAFFPWLGLPPLPSVGAVLGAFIPLGILRAIIRSHKSPQQLLSP